MNFKDLENYIDYITDWKIPGADCVVYYKNECVFRKISGYSDIKNQKKLSEDNLYYVYSITKPLVCAAALQLFEKGKFLLTDPVSEYLPEFKELYVQMWGDPNNEITKAKNPILIKQLFTMTAGLCYLLDTPDIRKLKEETDNKCPTLKAVAAIAKFPLIYEPGTHWFYSLSHDVLGALIEVVSGEKLSEYLRKNIFEPLGMKDTGFYLTDENRPRMSVQYFYDDEKKTAVEVPLINAYQIGSEYESGGAGLISSVNDYIKFANALATYGKYDKNVHILSKPTIDLMRMNHLDENQMKDFIWPSCPNYGYGLGVRTLIDKAKSGSLSSVGEFGWEGAAGSYLLIDPDRELAVFYAQHMHNNQAATVHPRLRNIIYKCLDD